MNGRVLKREANVELIIVALEKLTANAVKRNVTLRGGRII